ncbi:Centromere/kinetochore Zw10-domain-containing protein [Kalaharituber pfeilii]|nr:Centromere/kinetochore Zw10-domain-containing protein [Kalaharituber pfeilii]
MATAAVIDSSSSALSDALLKSILQGEFPDELTSITELKPEAIPVIINDLEKAIESVKSEIKGINKSNGSQINFWVRHASKLHEDVEKSKEKAREIVKMEEKEKALHQSIHDAQAKHTFLSAEIKFNQSLASILGSLQLIGNTVDQVSMFVEQGDLGMAIAQLQAAEHALGQLGCEGIIVVGLMKEKVAGMKRTLVDAVESYWSRLISSGKEGGEGWVRIVKEVKGPNGVVISGDTVLEALGALGLSKARVDGLHQLIDAVLVKPRLEVSRVIGDVPSYIVEEETSTIRIKGRSNDLSAAHLYSDLHLIVNFLHGRLPSSLQRTFSRIFTPSLNTRLISTYLPATIPSALSALPRLQAVLQKTSEFESYLKSISWTLELDLQDWVERAPRVWLAKRREDALDTTRVLFATGKVKVTKVVERSETMQESPSSPMAGTDKGSDDSWDQNWFDDESKERDLPTQSKKGDTPMAADKGKERPSGAEREVTKSLILSDDEEDASGWGLDEDLDLGDVEDEGGENKPEEKVEVEAEGKKEAVADDGAPPQIDDMDWGDWGEDDNDGTSTANVTKAKNEPKARQQQEQQQKHQPKEQQKPKIPTTPTKRKRTTKGGSSPSEITLTETYTITGMPDGVIEIIRQLLEDVKQLSTNAKYTSSPIAPAAPMVLALPVLVLAAYRALAPIYYSTGIASKMFLHNDCVRIEEKLRDVQAEFAAPTGIFAGLSLEGTAMEMAAFGKRWYSKDLEAQRIILRDYLDGTQGLVACTEYPQSTTCENAIKAVVDRLRLLHSKWEPVLSRSTLYQALGSLLSTVCTKITNDISDISDISDAESRRLASFCAEVGKLEELFLTGIGGEAEVPKTAVYTPGWLKFRYLENILECTMVELIELYDEGLLVDFEKEELMDLVRALFADTENRRRCLDVIRRGPKGGTR